VPEKRGKTFSPHRYSSSLNTLTNGTDGRANFLANVCLVSESELANVVSSQLALTDANPNPTPLSHRLTVYTPSRHTNRSDTT